MQAPKCPRDGGRLEGIPEPEPEQRQQQERGRCGGLTNLRHLSSTSGHGRAWEARWVDAASPLGMGSRVLQRSWKRLCVLSAARHDRYRASHSVDGAGAARQALDGASGYGRQERYLCCECGVRVCGSLQRRRGCGACRCGAMIGRQAVGQRWFVTLFSVVDVVDVSACAQDETR
jgi:hypothetical protein